MIFKAREETKNLKPTHVPSLKEYLTPDSNATDIAFRAAANGHTLILEIILDDSLCQHRKQLSELKAKIARYHATRLSLLRKYHFLKIERLFANLLLNVEILVNELGIPGLEHINVIDLAMQKTIDHIMHSLVLSNRASLTQAKTAFVRDELVTLTTEARLKLHLQFRTDLIHEVKYVEQRLNDTFSQPDIPALQPDLQIRNVIKEIEELINETTKSLKLNKKELRKFLSSLDMLNQTIEKINQARINKILNLINSSHQQGSFKPNNQLDDIELILKMGAVNNLQVDSQNNSLLHVALLHGRYETAIYLVSKKHDLFAPNSLGVKAIDIQDAQGNFLLLYLAAQGRYDNLCEHIERGANISLINKDHLGILNVTFANKTFLHYLIANINSTKHFKILLNFIKQSLPAGCLLTEVAGKTFFEIILELPEQQKETLLVTLKGARLADHFYSPFQCDINFALWQHFFFLVKQQSLGWFDKKKGNINKPSTIEQLKFMDGICKQLSEAVLSCNDSHLYRFLTETISHLQLPPEPTQRYNRYLVSSLYSREAHNSKVKNNGKYYIHDKSEAQDCYLDPTLEMIKKPLAARSSSVTVIATEQKESNHQPESVIEKKNKQRCTLDLLGGFKPKSTQTTSNERIFKNSSDKESSVKANLVTWVKETSMWCPK